MASTLQYRHLLPDGSKTAAVDTGACCRDCGSREVLWLFRKKPDGTREAVGPTQICCGCSRAAGARTLSYFYRKPDGSRTAGVDTGGCCDCIPGTGCDPMCGCQTSPDAWTVHGFAVDFVILRGAAGLCYWFGNHGNLFAPPFGPIDCVFGLGTGELRCDEDEMGWTLTIIYSGPCCDPGPCSATYKLSAASWDCDGPNTMTLVSSTGSLTWPGSVTLTPGIWT